MYKQKESEFEEEFSTESKDESIKNILNRLKTGANDWTLHIDDSTKSYPYKIVSMINDKVYFIVNKK